MNNVDNICVCENNAYKCFNYNLNNCTNKKIIIDSCPYLRILLNSSYNKYNFPELKNSELKLEEFYKLFEYLIENCLHHSINERIIVLLSIYNLILNNQKIIDLMYIHYEQIIKLLIFKLNYYLNNEIILNKFIKVFKKHFKNQPNIYINILKNNILLLYYD
jgi:hypothetical protein